MDIAHEPNTREFVAHLDGYRAALQYDLDGDLMIITHTRVPEIIRHRGLAAELTRVALDTARAAGWTVRPECLYTLAFLRAHGEYADLVETTPSEAQRRHADALLDEALEESFPASDPPAVGGSLHS